MKRIALLFLLTVLVFARDAEFAGSTSTKTVTVRLFTANAIRKATITPIGSGNWMRSCSTCNAQTVSSPLRLEMSGGQIRVEHTSTKQLELHGSFRIKPDSIDYAPYTSGNWRIRATGSNMQVLLSLPIERYLMAVLSGEAAPDEPLESLKAMAVAMRTFTLVNASRHSIEGFGLCDTTHCQVSRFLKFRPEIEKAVEETRGETLWSGKQLARVTYTEHCGGITEDANNVWNGTTHYPYLVSHPDAYCLKRTAAEWHSQMTLEQLASIGKREGWRLPAHIDAVAVTKSAPTGRAMTIEFRDGDAHVALQSVVFRYAVDKAMGLYQIRSDWYTVSLKDGVLSFIGKGYGHGVGLCQAGAYQMALEGRNYREILSFYFPTTEVHSSPQSGSATTEDNGFEPMPSQTLAAKPAGDDALWDQAKALLPWANAIRPTLHIAATSEEFHQATGEAEWVLSAARGKDVYLQSSANFANTGQRSDALLREYLRSIIDQSSLTKTPPWLRTGLAEALAKPSQKTDIAGLTPVELDAMLAHPSDAAAKERANAAAGVFVQRLIQKHGMAKVQSWLKAGVPSTINDSFFPAGSSAPLSLEQRKRKPQTSTAKNPEGIKSNSPTKKAEKDNETRKDKEDGSSRKGKSEIEAKPSKSHGKNETEIKRSTTEKKDDSTSFKKEKVGGKRTSEDKGNYGSANNGKKATKPDDTESKQKKFPSATEKSKSGSKHAKASKSKD